MSNLSLLDATAVDAQIRPSLILPSVFCYVFMPVVASVPLDAPLILSVSTHYPLGCLPRRPPSPPPYRRPGSGV